MIKKLSLLNLFVLGMSFTGALLNSSAKAIPVTNAYINFAGAGGDFSSRTATFSVPDKTTITPVKNGLRLYEVHLAKMIEITEDFCQDRENDYVIHWNYEAEDGKVFMGQYNLTCQFAENTMKKFGSSKTENITINYQGNPDTINLKTLNLNSKNAKEFATLIQSIKPYCIDSNPKICPGDRLD